MKALAWFLLCVKFQSLDFYHTGVTDTSVVSIRNYVVYSEIGAVTL